MRFLALVMVIFLLLSGCSTANETKTNKHHSIKLVVWHDKGEDGINFFKEINRIYQREHPNIEIVSSSFPTSQWQQKTLASISTNTPPNLIFNDATRLMDIQQNTHSFTPLDSIIDQSEGASYITKNDNAFLTYDNKKMIYPINRSLAALGIRKSWLQKVDEPFPKTWEDFVRVAKKFKEEDPDQNGKDDTFGFTMHLGVDPGQTFNLFMNGSGKKDVWLKKGPETTISKNKHNLAEISKLYNAYSVMPKDAVTQDFTEMYKLIESGSVGMFRTGNWNVKKWDQNEVLKGDYITGPWPSMKKGSAGNLVQLNVRGFALPKNAKYKQDAKEFLTFMLSKEAQQLSNKYFSSAVREDVQINQSSTMEPFYKYPVQPIDTYFSQYDYYINLNEKYEQMLSEVINNPASKSNEILKKGTKNIDSIISIKKDS